MRVKVVFSASEGKSLGHLPLEEFAWKTFQTETVSWGGNKPRCIFCSSAGASNFGFSTGLTSSRNRNRKCACQPSLLRQSLGYKYVFNPETIMVLRETWKRSYDLMRVKAI